MSNRIHLTEVPVLRPWALANPYNPPPRRRFKRWLYRLLGRPFIP